MAFIGRRLLRRRSFQGKPAPRLEDVFWILYGFPELTSPKDMPWSSRERKLILDCFSQPLGRNILTVLMHDQFFNFAVHSSYKLDISVNYL